MGMERRGCVDQPYLVVNQQWEEPLRKARPCYTNFYFTFNKHSFTLHSKIYGGYDHGSSENCGECQQCPVRKLHAVVLPLTPTSPPEAGGEGVEEVTGFSNHKALNQQHFSPLPIGHKR